MEAEFMTILASLVFVALLPADSPSEIVNQKLVAAFGKDCKELQRPLRVWIPERRLLLAAEEYSLEADGRVRLGHCSMALFPGKSDQEGRALTTHRSECVLLTVDRPIEKAEDF